MKPANIAPIFATLYPGMCDVARNRGYALAVHGSVVTDFDLIAVPWSDAAVPAEELKNAIMEHVGAVGYGDLLRRESHLTEDMVQQILARKENRTANGAEPKPHGRLAWNLYLGNGVKIDLSVMPLNSDAIRVEVAALLKLMSMLDPHGGEERHGEWPLQLRGDEDATSELCQCLNKLQELVK